MRARALHLLALATVCLVASPASAQYMYLDSNGDGIHTAADAVEREGVTTFDVWLDTSHNRDGSAEVCDNGEEQLTIFSYEFILHASGGTVAWGAYTNAQTIMLLRIQPATSNSDFYSGYYFDTYVNPSGLYRLGSLSFTVSSGNPSIQFAASTPLRPDYLSSFGTQCAGIDYDSTYKLGTDWFDADGLGSSCPGGCAPWLLPVADMTLDEGATVSQALTVTDVDGSPITFRKVSGPMYMFVTTADPGTETGTATGALSLAPGYADAGTGIPASVSFTDGILQGNTRSFTITVHNVNRQPAADAGGPYSGIAGIPIAFDGTRSADPDGDALSYSWDFGDLRNAVGPTPAHTYASEGTYDVSLTVGDGASSATAATTATITRILDARAFTTRANRVIRLGSGKSAWSIQIEPIGRSFETSSVDVSTIRMSSAGTGSVSEISATSGKTVLGGDTDGNGAQEITATFAKSDLRDLFLNVNGKTSVPVTLRGNLTTGGSFRALADVGVIGAGGAPVSSLWPNPMNPEATLSIFIPRPGILRVRILDSSGRLVRSLLDETSVAAGYRDVRFDGRSNSGAAVASGIYFYQVETAAGATTGRFAVLR